MNTNTELLAAPINGQSRQELLASRAAATCGDGEAPSGSSEADRCRLLEPRPRSSGLLTLWQVVSDYLRGLYIFHRVGPCVTVFGSARTRPEDQNYQLARRMGGAIARLGFTVMTGGGPGIMEAANRGARESGGRSVGCNIKLPFEQSPNPFLDRCVTLRFFSVRKTLLERYSYAFVVFPGGAGTMDEMFEALTLIQTGKMEPFPIVLMGVEYWREMMDCIEMMARVGAISPRDLGLLYVTDSVEDAIAYIRRHAIEPFGLRLGARRSQRWVSWLTGAKLARTAVRPSTGPPLS